MSDQHNDYIEELTHLISLTFDGKISEEQFIYLDDELKCSSKARECFLKMLTIYTAFNDYSNSGIILDQLKENIDFDIAEDAGENLNINMLLKLARDENIAPGIELPKDVKEEPVPEIIETKTDDSVKKQSKWYYIALAATIGIVLGFIFLSPDPGYETATLVSTIDAKWEINDLGNGYRFVVGNDQIFQLNEGFAEVLFDNNTLVTFEAPAEFQVINDKKIDMKYGRLYANVAKEATGFTVQTLNSTIVDLGTEFGIESYSSRVSELHVLNGKVALDPGVGQVDKTVQLKEGAARMVVGSGGEVNNLQYEPLKFARKIDSASKYIWRGESLKLTDYISGGDGFGDVKELGGIDYKTGRYITNIKQDGRVTDSKYHLVPYSKYIDGVFVPDGGNGLVEITSAGHTFDCPDTTGEYTHETLVYKGNINEYHTTIPQLVIYGKEYINQNILVLHSNGGITFDLAAIRERVPGVKLSHFKSYGGISEVKALFDHIPNVDFWVLVDGEIRYQKKSLNLESGMIKIDITLSDVDQYLTFIVTDGMDTLPENYQLAAVGNDFLHLVDPVITLKADIAND